MNCQNLYILCFLTFTMTSCTLTKEPLIIGHRGAKGHIAENTLPSIAKAMELGVDGIEIDIFKCASGELVVFHDKTLEKLPKEGKKNALAICPGFSSDCVETLEEILIQGKESFIGSGGENFDMVPCLNDNDDHITLLKSLIQKSI